MNMVIFKLTDWVNQQVNNQNNNNIPWFIVFFLSTLTLVSESAKVMHQKPMRFSLLIVKQLNFHDNTYQGRFLVVRQYFTVRYKNPTQGDRQITQVIKPIRSSSRSLKLKGGLLRVFFNFSKQSPLLSHFRLFWTVLFDSRFCIYEW